MFSSFAVRGETFQLKDENQISPLLPFSSKKAVLLQYLFHSRCLEVHTKWRKPQSTHMGRHSGHWDSGHPEQKRDTPLKTEGFMKTCAWNGTHLNPPCEPVFPATSEQSASKHAPCSQEEMRDFSLEKWRSLDRRHHFLIFGKFQLSEHSLSNFPKESPLLMTNFIYDNVESVHLFDMTMLCLKGK